MSDVTDSNEVGPIILAEYTRLTAKQKELAIVEQSHRRSDFFKRMSVKRNYAYWKMFAVGLSLAVAVLLLFWLKIWFPIIPSFVITVGISLIVGLGGIYICILFWDYFKRDYINFDEVYSSSPVDAATNLKNKATTLQQDGDVTAAMLLGFGANCHNGNCCATGTLLKDNKCVEAFGTVYF